MISVSRDHFAIMNLMTDKTIINLPIKDFAISRLFFVEIGFPLNEALSDENSLCFDISSMTTIALLPNTHFAEATRGELADTTKAHEVLISIGKDSEQAVDLMIEAAVKAGGAELHEPIHTNNIYGRSFSDLDGHQWNLFYKS